MPPESNPTPPFPPLQKENPFTVGNVETFRVLQGRGRMDAGTNSFEMKPDGKTGGAEEGRPALGLVFPYRRIPGDAPR